MKNKIINFLNEHKDKSDYCYKDFRECHPECCEFDFINACHKLAEEDEIEEIDGADGKLWIMLRR